MKKMVGGNNSILNYHQQNRVFDSMNLISPKATIDGATTDVGSTEQQSCKQIIDQCSGSLLFGKKNLPCGPKKGKSGFSTIDSE